MLLRDIVEFAGPVIMESLQRLAHDICDCTCRVIQRRCPVWTVGMGGVWKPLDYDAVNHDSGHRWEHLWLLLMAILLRGEYLSE